jgi:hypothetical protein
MTSEKQARPLGSVVGVPASLALHAALIGLLVVYAMPRPLQQQEEPAVDITYVPPPEEPKPVPPKPAEQPKPKPPPPAESLKSKPPPPVAEPPKAAEKAPPEAQPIKPSQIEILKPVFQFGEKDAGPRKSNGGSAQDSAPAPAQADIAKPPPAATTEPEETVATQNSEPPPDAPDGSKEGAEKQAAPEAEAVKDAAAQDAEQPQPIEQGASEGGAEEKAEAAPTPLTTDSEIEVALPASAKLPQPRPADVPKVSAANTAKPGAARFAKPGGGAIAKPNPGKATAPASERYAGLPGVRRLDSRASTGNALATSAMAGIPREQRVARLCASELQQQLSGAAYFPDLVPLIPLEAGNVVDIPDAAFRARTEWYSLSFKCEIDPDATKVLSFDFRVGPSIPRAEWARHGFPDS